MSAVAVDQNLLEAAVGRLAEDGLTALRKKALLNFGKTGFPSLRHEDWRYTNLAAAAELSNSCLSEPSLPAAPGSVDIGQLTTEIDAHWIVVSNGTVIPETLSALQAAGVSITPLSASVNSVEVHIDDPLSSFNASLLSDGLLVRIADNAKVEKPIGLLLLDDAETAAGLSQTRFIIDLGRNASASFVELHRSSGNNAHFANSVIQIELGTGASADYVRLQERGAGHLQIGRLQALLREGATLNYTSIDVGGKLIRNDVVATIDGAHATANISGIYLADGKQHIDNHILIDHRVGPATSRQNYRGIVGGRARCVFNGKALVREGADGTDAEQSNHNLLLSDTAEIDTKPELVIYADDVKCSHGTTVGQLDKTALFYLQSRGLTLEQGKILLTRAFAGHILRKLPLENVKKYANQMIDRKLDRLTGDSGQ